MEFFGRYIEVIPNSRIVWTNDEGEEEGAVTTVTFEERGGETLVVMRDLYPTKEALDEAIASGSTSGFSETFEQLDELSRYARALNGSCFFHRYRMRRPMSIAEPDAIIRCAAILARWAGGAWRLQVEGLIAAIRRTPAQFGAIVRIVRHLEIRSARSISVLHRQRPWRAIAARIAGDLARGEF